MDINDFVCDFIENKILKECSCVSIKTISNEYMRLNTFAKDDTVRRKIKSNVDNRADVLVLRPKASNEADVVVSREHIENIFFQFNDEYFNTNELEKLTVAVNGIRKKILDKPPWVFQGSFKGRMVLVNIF